MKTHQITIINQRQEEAETVRECLYGRAIIDLLFLFSKPDNLIPEFDKRINGGGMLSWLYQKIKNMLSENAELKTKLRERDTERAWATVSDETLSELNEVLRKIQKEAEEYLTKKG
jgi:hypothetical protein